jgi:SAM-dependent methyltransferase
MNETGDGPTAPSPAHSDIREQLASNQRAWNAWTPHHVGSAFYDVAGFKTGRDTLSAIEPRILGEVSGKSLLHLQCHFGLDTLSWARRGALVTGVDFSSAAIAAATALAADTGLAARFVESDVYELERRLEDRFDIVFSSHGAIWWLPDLKAWALVIAHFLKPGGRFFLFEGHPFAMMFDEKRGDRELHVKYPYFDSVSPLLEQGLGSYAAPESMVPSTTFSWLHSMSEIVGSLLEAGLSITNFEEYPFLAWPFFPWMEQRDDGFWQLPASSPQLPMSFSLLAEKR